jgi:hypothetical protein
MSLGQVAAARTAAVGDATLTYQQAFLGVSQALTALAVSTMPVLQSPPAGWPQMVETYVQIQAAAADWLGALTGFCSGVPKEITNSAALTSTALQTAQQSASALAANPENQAAQAALSGALDVLSAQLGMLAAAIQSAGRNILAFQQNVPGLLQNLQALTNDFAAVVSADQVTVAALTADIAALNQDIQTLQDQIERSTNVSEITLWLARVTPEANAPLIGLKLLLIALSAYSEYYVDLSADEIQADEQQIANDTSGITTATADVTACQVQVGICQTFSNQVSTFNTALAAVISAWQALAGDIATAVADVQTTIVDADAQAYTTVESDLGTVASAWAALSGAAAGLVLDVQVSDAVLQVGMTQPQVEQALNAAGSTSLAQIFTAQLG